MNSKLLCISRYMFSLAIVLLPVVSAVAMPVVNVDFRTQHIELIDVVEYLEDSSGKLTLDEVRHLPASRFSRLARGNYIRNFTASAFWIRFAVHNTDGAAIDWIVQHEQASADSVDFWIVINGKVAEHAAIGGQTDLADRQMLYRYPAIRHISLPGEVSQVYIRVYNTDAAADHMIFVLDSGLDFTRRSTLSQSLLGIMYGVPLVLAFSALAGWVVSRDRSFVTYSLYAMATLAVWLGLNGESIQHVFAESPTPHNNAWHIFFLLSPAFGIMFARDFLQTRTLMPRMDQSMQLFVWICCAGAVLRLAGAFTSVTQLAMTMLVCVFHFVCSAWGWCALKKGIAYARWYMAAQLSCLLTLAAYLWVGQHGLRPYDSLLYIFTGIPFITELLLLAVAQHDRTCILQRDKDKAERDAIETISRSEERLRIMADYLPMLIAYVDREERYRFCNRHYETMMHLKPDELLGRRICDVMGKDNYVKIASHIETVWTGQTVSFERTIEKYGAKQHIQYKYIPDIGKNGEVVGFYSLISDITERKEAQRKQLASEKLLRAVTDNLPALVCYIDQEHRFQFNNRLYEKWFNRPISEITGRKVREVYGEEVYQEYKSYFDLVLLGQNSEFEFEIKRRDDVRYYKATYVPQTDEQGIVNGICGLISDVTAMKRITEEYRRQKLEADSANASKSRFLAAASHDLRQPLHALGLLTANLKTATNEEDRQHILDHIERVLEGMDSQFHALLDVSKLDAGVIKPEPFDFPINDLLESITTEYGGQVAEKGLKLTVHRSRLAVHSDPVLIGQVLRNLVSNAIKHIKSGHVTVGCHRIDEQHCWLAVIDTGPGIPEHEQENVFQEFYQLDNPQRDRNKGMGLGLAIVRRIARLLGCELSLYSKVGRGTLFRMKLPISHRAPAQKITTQVAELSNARFTGRFVVVLDDDQYIVDNTTVLLKGWGCTVLSAGTYRELEMELSQTDSRPDLLLFDYTTRDRENGVELAHKLQKKYADHPPPVLILTGDTSPEKLADLRASGFHLLTKPARPARLRVVMGRIFEETEATGQST